MATWTHYKQHNSLPCTVTQLQKFLSHSLLIFGGTSTLLILYLCLQIIILSYILELLQKLHEVYQLGQIYNNYSKNDTHVTIYACIKSVNPLWNYNE